DVVDRSELTAREIRVVPDGRETGLPGEGVCAVRVERRALQGRLQVRHVRYLGVVQFLQPPAVDYPGRHPVGEDHEIAANVLACLELCLHLGEPVDVVVDLFEILNRDARLLGEVFEGSGLEPSVLDVVDVEGPVGESEGAITVSTVASVTGARGEEGRSAQ